MLFTKRDKRSNVEKLIEAHLEHLLNEAKTNEDISGILALMERLEELRKNKKQVTPDTVLIVAGNLLGIVLMLNYERLGVITSKALNFGLRGRV